MEFADQVKAQVDIVQTVSEYGVRLRKMGRGYVGLCPFHKEKTPSFHVNPALGRYTCFGCGARGDLINFVQQVETLTFWEALKAIAERNAIPIPQRRDRGPDPETELRAALFEMYEQAALWCAQNLFGPPGAAARDYLSKRGLNGSTAQQFLLGYSENSWDALRKRFGSRYSPEQLEASGLFGKREDGGFYDKFRGRLMFPIHNESGKVIGFGGRALNAGDEPKYLNSPETAIYKKSSVLYNLHRAKDTMKRQDRTILVEGYMDVIGVFAAGVRNVVASCGTALTPMQVRCMKRYSGNIVVNFDPDNAGANATEKSIEMLIDEGMHMRVLELEGGLDPDEFIRDRGADAYHARLDSSANYFIWLADRARKKFGATTAEARMQGYETLLLPAIRRIHDPLERATVANEVAGYLGLDRTLVLSEFRKIPAQRRTAAPGVTDVNRIPIRERVLLRSLVHDPEIRSILLPRLTGFAVVKSFATWHLIERISAFVKENPEFAYAAVEESLDDRLKSLMSAAVFADHSSEVLSPSQAEVLLEQLEAEERETQLQDVYRRIQEAERGGNLPQAMELMGQAEELKRRNRRVTG